jgi:hypothetical protein
MARRQVREFLRTDRRQVQVPMARRQVHLRTVAAHRLTEDLRVGCRLTAGFHQVDPANQAGPTES